MPRSTPFRPGIVFTALLALAGCGGGDSGPGQSPLVVAKATSGVNGDAQTGAPGDELKEPLRVLITRDGQPVTDEDVDWEAQDDGSVDPATATTNASGIAETFWTLGPGVGAQTATAEVSGADGSPVTFTATAEDPGAGGATVQVLTDGGNRFQPEDVTIVAGQSVTWVWPAGGLPHNVSPDDATPVRSGDPVAGPEEYVFTFATPGVYQYFCEAHGNAGGNGMSGTVTVDRKSVV